MIEAPLEWPCWERGESVLGLDEAGRGPICGPLVVAGVRLPAGYFHPDIDDSKRLSEKKREALYDVILEAAEAFEILVVDEKTIDRLNIYRATQKAMEQIADAIQADRVLTDAMKLTTRTNYDAIVKGDHKSLSIAAASILAKVTRDRIMKELDALYPMYGLARHKGYPTKAHLEALHRYGLQDFYRRSYRPVAEMEEIKLFED